MELFTRTETGRYKAATKEEVCEAAHRLAQRATGQHLRGPHDIAPLAQALTAGLNVHEEAIVVTIDTQARVISTDLRFRGTYNRVDVPCREVARKAIEDGAARVLLIHNHPSGKAEPSAGDLGHFMKMKLGLAAIDIEILDDLIVGADGQVYSCLKQGIIS